MMMRLVAVAALVAAVAVGAVAVRARHLLSPAGEAVHSELFVIESGDSMGAFTRRLEERKLVRSARATRLLARWHGLDAQLHVGEYELSPHLRPAEILEIVTTGRVKTWPVTVPEGTRASYIALRLEEAGLADAQAFLEAASDPALAEELGVSGATLEGYLYPDTYRLPKGMGAREVARTMVRQFERVWREQIAERAAGSPLSKGEIVTLASIVEKETADPDERPLIAAVFMNRLERGMRLETDPTVIYGIPDFDGNLKRSHLRDRSNPYNTYRIPALPPGPIASPGAEALLAVVEPAETNYLYFVSRNDGTHEFSATYREHSAAVDEYQRRRRSRERASRR